MTTDHREHTSAPEAFAPRRTEKAPEELSLTGKFVPYQGGQPCMLNMPMSPHTYLPCFDTETELRRFLGRGDVTFDDIKEVTDGPDFLASIPHDIVVIAKLRWTERSTIKFLQIFRD